MIGPSAAASACAQTPVDTLAFHLDYLDAKLTAISSKYAEDISAEHAHDLHCAWDEVQQARGALDRFGGRPATDPLSTQCAADVDFEEFTARWDRANKPVGELFSDSTARSIAEWAARARYELAFVEAVRPTTLGRARRVERLDEAAAHLDRACRALNKDWPSSPQPHSARRRR